NRPSGEKATVRMVLPGISSPYEINRVPAGCTPANGSPVTVIVTALRTSGAKTIHPAHWSLVPLLRAVGINAQSAARHGWHSRTCLPQRMSEQLLKPLRRQVISLVPRKIDRVRRCVNESMILPDSS